MTARLFISHTSLLRQFDTKLNILITIYFANSKFQEFDVKIKENLLDDGLDIINVLEVLKPVFENEKITIEAN